MTEWTSSASVLLAAAGLGFTGRQFQLLTRDRQKERDLGINGVCVWWYPRSNPHDDEIQEDGTAHWVYIFTVNNPGRFPISEVVVEVAFTVDVRRVRGRQIDPPTRMMRLHQPVIAGGNERPWTRTLKINLEAGREHLHETTASVRFIDSEGNEQHTRWPATPLQPRTPRD